MPAQERSHFLLLGEFPELGAKRHQVELVEILQMPLGGRVAACGTSVTSARARALALALLLRLLPFQLARALALTKVVAIPARRAGALPLLVVVVVVVVVLLLLLLALRLTRFLLSVELATHALLHFLTHPEGELVYDACGTYQSHAATYHTHRQTTALNPKPSPPRVPLPLSHTHTNNACVTHTIVTLHV